MHIDHLKPYLGLQTPLAWNTFDTSLESSNPTSTVTPEIINIGSNAPSYVDPDTPHHTGATNRAGRPLKPKQIFSHS